MTAFEIRQHQSVFVNAGKGAFLIGVHFQNNPYHNQPQRSLWEKGYIAAKRKYEHNRQAEVLIGGVPIRYNRG